ncbi:MAG TPA: ATP-binding protein [Flavisolibacter sp.]|nr:ATP-binding protein [Flavisolibacter sp.]
MFRKMSPALRLAFIYLLVSVAWILWSDNIVHRLAGENMALFHRIQSIKGLLFVLLSSVLLYLVARKFYLNFKQSLQKAEEMLHRYNAVGEATKEGIIDHDLINDIAYLNEPMKGFILTGSHIIKNYLPLYLSRIHPEDRERIRQNLNNTLQTASTHWQADYRFKMGDGRYHDVISRGYIIREKSLRPLRIISSFQDVSEIRNMRTVFYEQQIRHKLMLGQSIINAQEEERNRWAEELHDNVCQLLTVVKLYLGQLSLENSSPYVLKAQEMTEKALIDIRQLSANIKPPEFTITTLFQALEELIANVKRVKQYKFETDLGKMNEKALSDDQKLMIYRVVQEQLNNIIKYSSASFVSISVKTGSDGQALIEIEDDGIGFDPSAARSGIGLKNIQSRLQVFSGHMSVESAPGKGCKLTAAFSLA